MKILIAVVLGLVLSSCTNSGRRGDDDDDTTIRSGQQVPIENQQYYDDLPSLSADGSQVAFLSGRNNKLQMFTFSVGDDTPSRLTSDDDAFDGELEGKISPDGTYVVFIGTKDGSTNVYSKRFDGTGDLNVLSDSDGGIESRLDISADSRLIVFVRRSSSVAGAKVFAAVLDGGGTLTRETQLTATDDDEDYPTFIPNQTSGSYTVLTVRRQTTGFIQSVYSRTISISSDSITVSGESEISDARSFDRGIGFSGGINSAYFVTDSDGEGEFSNHDLVPSGTVASAETIKVLSLVGAYDIAEGDASNIGVNLGANVVGLSSAKVADGAIGIVVREAWSCDEKELSYYTRLKVINQTDEVSFAITPQFTVTDGVPSLSGINQDLCTLEDGEEQDVKIRSVAINGNATSTNFTLAYGSLYNKDDSEVYLLSYDGTDYTWTEVSQNKSP